jgi:hypothetical protein
MVTVPHSEAAVAVIPFSWWFCLTTGRDGKNQVIRRERRIFGRDVPKEEKPRP